MLDFGHGVTLNRTGLGQVTITRTAGLQTNNPSRAVGLGTPTTQGIGRIWTVETATAPVVVTLAWVADADGSASFATMQAWRAPRGSASWPPAGTSGAATVSGNSRSFSFSTVALGRLTLGGLAAPLPVTLVAFTATAVSTSWSTRPLPTTASASCITACARSIPTARVSSPVRTVAVERSAQPAGLALFPNPTRAAATLTGAQPGAAAVVFDAAALVLPSGLATGVYVVRLTVE